MSVDVAMVTEHRYDSRCGNDDGNRCYLLSHVHIANPPNTEKSAEKSYRPTEGNFKNDFSKSHLFKFTDCRDYTRLWHSVSYVNPLVVTLGGHYRQPVTMRRNPGFRPIRHLTSR